MVKRDKKDKNNKNKKQDPFEQFESPSSSKGRKGRGKGITTKKDKNWDSYLESFQEYLLPRGIYTRDVEHDGNCLFRSIADVLDGDENVHEKYRDLAVSYISKNKWYFSMFLMDNENIDTYIKNMSEDGKWGGHFELVALSSVLNVKFCIHMKDKEPTIVKSNEKDLKGVKVVHLAYHVGEHYSSVRRIGDNAKAPAKDIHLDFEDSDGVSTEESEKELALLIKETEELDMLEKSAKKTNGTKSGFMLSSNLSC